MPPKELRGIVGFPSYHTLQALVLMWYARGLKAWRWPAIVLNLAVLAAVPVHGGHHIVDAFGGAAVTVVSVALASWIVAAEQRRASATSAEAMPGALPAYRADTFCPQTVMLTTESRFAATSGWTSTTTRRTFWLAR